MNYIRLKITSLFGAQGAATHSQTEAIIISLPGEGLK